MTWGHLGGLVVALAILPAAHAEPASVTSVAGAAAGASAAAPAATTTARTTAPIDARHGLALGVELGEPSSATVAWYSRKLVVVGAVGTGTFEGRGLQLHVDAQREVTRLAAAVPLRLGLGARLYHHGYAPASIDEVPDTHLGLRGTVAVAIERGAMELSIELVPGVDVLRSSSCSLVSGARSICPHALESPLFLGLTVGARWMFGK